MYQGKTAISLSPSFPDIKKSGKLVNIHFNSSSPWPLKSGYGRNYFEKHHYNDWNTPTYGKNDKWALIVLVAMKKWLLNLDMRTSYDRFETLYQLSMQKYPEDIVCIIEIAYV